MVDRENLVGVEATRALTPCPHAFLLARERLHHAAAATKEVRSVRAHATKSRWQYLFNQVKTCKVAAIAFIAVAALGSPSRRSVTPVASGESAITFDPTHSAGLFVGVQKFDHNSRPEVPFAVDDAVDLAHLFAFDPRVRLVLPRRIVLAISGSPRKPESQQRLNELARAGARVTSASKNEILMRLDQQAALAGNGGLLILTFATHGFLRDGIQHVLCASGNAISTANIADVIEARRVPRSLILIDACKVRVAVKGRGVGGDAAESARLSKRMRRVSGQVVLSTVGPAYDDPVRRNGVFTAAVIDGLQCKATTTRDDVTAQTLISYVDQSVRSWIRKNVDHSIGAATQFSYDSEANNMPLAHCGPPAFVPMSLEVKGTKIVVYSENRKKLLWQRDVEEPITHVSQADGTVVAGTQKQLIAFRGDGTKTWSMTGPATLQALTSGDLFRRHHHHFVAVWGSRVAIYSADGDLVSNCETGEALREVAILRTTSHHAPRIVVVSANRILLFDPKKLANHKPLWSAHLLPRSATIESVKVVDHDHDSRSEIELTTPEHEKVYVDGQGHVIERTPSVRLTLEKR